MEKVRVDLGNNTYDILIGTGLLRNLGNLIGKSSAKSFLFVDKNIYKLYKDSIDMLLCHEKFQIEGKEDSKSIETVSHVLKKMLDKGGNRKSKLIAVGGGVVGDLGGFAASIYMRGIPYIQVPTTLLAQVDSSVGGKTAINLGGYKNSIGSFYQPQLVIIDIDFLKTLPYREILSGLGEIIKYGLIYDYEFFKYIVENIDNIKNLDKDVMTYIIKHSLEIKAKVVSQDEKEEGLRKILNFGHTLGHGLEAITDFSKYSHGQAVIIGMYYETLIGKQLGTLKEGYAREILGFLSGLGLDLNIENYPKDALINIMKKDKKNTDNKISFILPIDRGRVKEYLLDSKDIKW